MDRILKSVRRTTSVVTQSTITTIPTTIMEIYHKRNLSINPVLPAYEQTFTTNISFSATSFVASSSLLVTATSTTQQQQQFVSMPDVAWSTSDEFNDPGYTLRYGLLGSVILRYIIIYNSFNTLTPRAGYSVTVI